MDTLIYIHFAFSSFAKYKHETDQIAEKNACQCLKFLYYKNSEILCKNFICFNCVRRNPDLNIFHLEPHIL